MAKLHSYFVLCPLLDRKSFLGAARGRDPSDVIVTLGRNVVNKYRITDQKQIGGWTSKDHITAAVVYDKEQDQYVGVFNQNTLKMWHDGTENLEKIRKYKFSSQILRVIKNGDDSIVVFSNGNCATLQYAVDQRKIGEDKPILRSSDTIVDMATYQLINDSKSEYICYIVQSGRGNLEIVTCALQSDLGDLVRSKLQKHKVIREEPDIRVVGKVICVEQPPTVYFLWSDSKIYAFDLTKSTWKLSGTVPWISTKLNVSLEWMGEKHLILFGSDMHEDGAIIVAFNVALGVGSCRYPMKMYCENAKVYCFNERLILEAGNHLGMLPYALETSRSLSSLLATHEILADDYTELADWGVGAVAECDAGEYQELLKKGMTEQSIAKQVLPPLMISGRQEQVLQVIKEFTDIPEDIIVKLLVYVIKLYNYDDSILRDESKFRQFYEEHVGNSDFLNYVFNLPFSDAILIPHLRDGLDLKGGLFLLTYICHLLEDETVSRAFGVDYERKILDWCALLMDAFYQQYLTTNDENVTIALNYTSCVISKLIERLDEISGLLPLLNGLLNQNKKVSDFEATVSYTIEILDIL